MTPEVVAQIINQALMATFWLGAPLLIIAFIVGVVINLVQIATSMQDSAFSAVPRLAAFLVSFLLLMPWMIQKASSYAIFIFGDLGRYAK